MNISAGRQSVFRFRGHLIKFKRQLTRYRLSNDTSRDDNNLYRLCGARPVFWTNGYNGKANRLASAGETGFSRIFYLNYEIFSELSGLIISSGFI